ncbi:MAG: N-acetylgalactosamine 6-sulfate sulfatase, partial [Akkermansiaceae bacterium]
GQGTNSIQAIRWEDWKAVRPGPGKPIELYDLSKDLSESRNLAETNPEQVAKAVEMMKQARTPHPLWPDPALAAAKPNKAKN